MGYYQEIRPTRTVNILGTEYSIYLEVSSEDDPVLEKCDGYCDKTTKRVVVSAKHPDCNLGNFKVYEKTTLRHELIHAFLFESGLDGNSRWGNDDDDHPEQIVQWMAIQIPKMWKIFEEADAL